MFAMHRYFFCNGKLEYYALPADGPTKSTHMSGDRYEWLSTLYDDDREFEAMMRAAWRLK